MNEEKKTLDKKKEYSIRLKGIYKQERVRVSGEKTIEIGKRLACSCIMFVVKRVGLLCSRVMVQLKGKRFLKVILWVETFDGRRHRRDDARLVFWV